MSNQSRKHRRQRQLEREAEQQKAWSQGKSAEQVADERFSQPSLADLEVRLNGEVIQPVKPLTREMLNGLAFASPFEIGEIMREIFGREMPPNSRMEIAPRKPAPPEPPLFGDFEYATVEARMMTQLMAERDEPRLKPAPSPKSVQLVDALSDAVNYLDGAPAGSRRDAISKVIDAAVEVCKSVGGADPAEHERLARHLEQSERSEQELQAWIDQHKAERPAPRQPGEPYGPETSPPEVAQLLSQHEKTIQELTKQLARARSVARAAACVIRDSFTCSVSREKWLLTISLIEEVCK